MHKTRDGAQKAASKIRKVLGKDWEIRILEEAKYDWELHKGNLCVKKCKRGRGFWCQLVNQGDIIYEQYANTVRKAVIALLVTEFVIDHQGCRATELAAHPELAINFEFEEISTTLAGMIASGELVQFDYILPTMRWRIKTMYFPKGTQICDW